MTESDPTLCTQRSWLFRGAHFIGLPLLVCLEYFGMVSMGSPLHPSLPCYVLLFCYYVCQAVSLSLGLKMQIDVSHKNCIISFSGAF